MEELKFEFGKYTEITDLAFKLNPSYKENGYVRFFICPDTNDFWFVRVLEGVNEDYEDEEGVYLIERNNIRKARGEKLTLQKTKDIILDDDGCNYDILECDSMDEVIENIADIFGINNLVTEKATA